jgi:hypothetical protein
MPTKTSSYTNVSGDGLDFSPGPPQEWIIDKRVIIGSVFADGVHSDYDLSVLHNFGHLISYSSSFTNAGVTFNGNHGQIVNEHAATITAYNFGVFVNDTGDNVENLGKIFGLGSFGEGICFGETSNHFRLINRGSIVTASDSVVTQSLFNHGFIDNYGSIRSAGDNGIDIFTSIGITTEITNARGAIIAGAPGIGNYGVYSASGGTVHLINNGTLNGGIYCSAATGRDTIINRGTIHGATYLEGSDALFDGTGGTSGDIFAGSNGVVIAGRGRLTIHVDAAHVILTAGPGHEKFVFDSTSIASQHALIEEFDPHLDKIVLSETVLAGLGPLGKLDAGHFGFNGDAHNTNPQIVYNERNGFLIYDSNGDLPGGQIHFATLAGDPHVSLANFLIVA